MTVQVASHRPDPDRFRADRFDGDGEPARFYVFDTHNGGEECAGPFDTIDNAITRQDRLNRLHALASEYPGPWMGTRNIVAMAVHRFAAVRSPAVYVNAYTVSTHATMRDALAQLADGVLEGAGPLGVIDLDTGASHGVHVATPVVSDIGGEGATRVPWDDGDGIPAVEPGAGATSVGGTANT